jgi:hypothetical protein
MKQILLKCDYLSGYNKVALGWEQTWRDGGMSVGNMEIMQQMRVNMLKVAVDTSCVQISRYSSF